MCVEARTGLSEGKLLEFILEAIPVIAYKRQLSDGRRIYAEIFEGTGIENGRVVGRTLYQYVIHENLIKDNCIKVVGAHTKRDKPSAGLISRLRSGGASEAELAQFL